MARDYAAEYQARQERAIEHGFSSYSQQRSYIERHAETIESGRYELGQEFGSYDPRAAHREGLMIEYGYGEGGMDRDDWGHLAHDIVGDYMDAGLTEAEAIAAMHELIGETP